ncbi:hypothetical protein [Mesobacillus jeotgali]|uniref:Uncharacterized protein n=1 Tax=Mesobacillus jeotgali TaxID=129985 RepID=A0ABY9VFR6_9BACI|nr:hypothetical protein [Mesobacillus jeotgali]WNF22418.1 hypothetical protein RH061_20010 [Mesobacillus jeotgali]
MERRQGDQSADGMITELLLIFGSLREAYASLAFQPRLKAAEWK